MMIVKNLENSVMIILIYFIKASTDNTRNLYIFFFKSRVITFIILHTISILFYYLAFWNSKNLHSI